MVIIIARLPVGNIYAIVSSRASLRNRTCTVAYNNMYITVKECKLKKPGREKCQDE